MSDMKCPFCQQELDYLAEDIYGNMCCPNCRDKNGFTYKASESIWQELIRTRKALGLALDWLREVATPEKCDDDLCREFTERKLAEIKTALEQKDT